MSIVSTPFYRAAKTAYYSIFKRLAEASLRRTTTKFIRGRLEKPSIKVVSYYGWQNGISEGALLQRVAFKALGYDVETVDVTRAMSNPFARVECKGADVFVVPCGGNQFLRAAWPLRHILPHGRVVAYFAWELPDPPRDWPPSRLLWDEIWTPSHYSASALSQWCDCPIKVVPHVLLRDDTKPSKDANVGSPEFLMAKISRGFKSELFHCTLLAQVLMVSGFGQACSASSVGIASVSADTFLSSLGVKHPRRPRSFWRLLCSALAIFGRPQHPRWRTQLATDPAD